VTGTGDALTPVQETQVALDWLESFSRDRRIHTSITRMGRRVREIVPDCVALSLGLLEDGLTFTLVSESRDAAVLDALQYIDGGPCVEALRTGQITELSDDAVDEVRWHLFARGQHAAGIASTLSLPIMRDSQVVCGVNLYASTPNAFDGHHEELAKACGAWAEGVVTNADLSFTTRLRAAATPARLRDAASVDAAAGFLAARDNVDIDTAKARLRSAAAQAGVREPDVAKFILDNQPADGT
jgi:GAF domain-containing protein